MHYMLLLMGEEANWEEISPEEAQASIDEMEALQRRAERGWRLRHRGRAGDALDRDCGPLPESTAT